MVSEGLWKQEKGKYQMEREIKLLRVVWIPHHKKRNLECGWVTNGWYFFELEGVMQEDSKI